MALLLDTCVVIDIIRRRQPDFRSALDTAYRRGEALHVSALTVAELVFGVRKSSRPERRQAEIDAFLQVARPVPFTAEDAAAAADLGWRRRLDGTPAGVIDTLIAGQALARGWSVVTRNVKHFAFAGGPPVIDWSISDQPLDPATIAASLRRPTKD